MKAENETRKSIDVYKWWLFMATDIIVEFTYGESFHMLEHGKVYPSTSKLMQVAV